MTEYTVVTLQIQRYCVLADLYSGMGFQRKAGFYRRIAGMQCVAPTNPKPDWLQCYMLLIKALPSYKLTLDYRDIQCGMFYCCCFITVALSLLFYHCY